MNQSNSESTQLHSLECENKKGVQTPKACLEPLADNVTVMIKSSVYRTPSLKCDSRWQCGDRVPRSIRHVNVRHALCNFFSSSKVQKGAESCQTTETPERTSSRLKILSFGWYEPRGSSRPRSSYCALLGLQKTLAQDDTGD